VGLAALARLATLQGLFKPVRIVGGSMAETLCGDHFELSCGDCAAMCRYDADSPPEDDRVVCPNCGFKNRELADTKIKRGERVFIDRLVYSLRSPRRWEIVAFRTLGDEDHLAVKRVVGLPGEHISIRRGDVHADGQLVQKSLDQLRAMAILVHDSAYPPRSGRDLPRRWQAESATSDWCEQRGKPTFRPKDDGSSEFDWLTYRHWRCVPGPGPRIDEYAVQDNYGYNQQMSRQLHQVADLMLVCRMCTTWDAGSLAFRIHHGRNCFQVELLPRANEGRLFGSGRLMGRFSLPAAAYARDVKVELAVCDGRVLFAVNELVLIQRAFEPTPGSHPPNVRPVAIGAVGESVEIRRLQVFRDIFYLDPAGLGWDWPAPQPLSADEFFVAGDNVPISEDSRNWSQVGLPRRLLLGKVLRRFGGR